MAVSRYKYVKDFEQDDRLLPQTFIVLRIDGRGFHKFSEIHEFEKPNDSRALELMNHAACSVVREYSDILLAFGQSDEYSFLFRKGTSLFGRRSSKILSTVVSMFTSTYIMSWHKYFNTQLPKPEHPPSFDGRIVLYPSANEVKDYFAWRQVDVHINNLYNTIFWALVNSGNQTREQAYTTLKGTTSSQKQEMLFSKFGINYNNIESMYRKGTVMARIKTTKDKELRTILGLGNEELESSDTNDKMKYSDSGLFISKTQDLMRDSFWSSQLAGFDNL